MPNIDRLDWSDLRFFLAAVKSGTLAGAARALGVKHSTVGRRLNALENALGAAVILRSEQGLQLTPLGEKLVPHALAVERSIAEFGEQAAAARTRVRVGVPTGLFKLFTPHLARLRRDHPEIALEFLSGSEPVDLRKGEAELAIRAGPVVEEELIVRKVGQTGWSLYAAQAYLDRHPEPIDALDLTGQELLGFAVRLSGVPGAKWMAEHGAGAHVALVNREMAEMTTAAIAGLGLAALPRILGDAEPSLKRVTPAIDGASQLSIVYRREAKLTDAVQVVIRFLGEVLRERLRAANDGHADAIPK